MIAKLFFFTALIFIFSLFWHPYSMSWLVKIVPMILLLALMMKGRYNRASMLIIMGLIFSAGGDIALDVDRKKLFILGLALFLIAHIFYIAAFSLYRERFSLKKHGKRIAFVVFFTSSMAILVWPHLGSLKIPVIAYITVIALMSCTASLQPGQAVFIGALIFMASDSLIAINKFLFGIKYAGLLIIVTYYLAQFLIVKGHLGNKPRI